MVAGTAEDIPANRPRNEGTGAGDAAIVVAVVGNLRLAQPNPRESGRMWAALHPLRSP